MTRHKGMAFTVILTVPSMKVTGLMINNMAKEKKLGPMEMSMKVASWKARSTVKAPKHGKMELSTLVSIGKTTYMGMVSTHGMMEEHMREIGKTT